MPQRQRWLTVALVSAALAAGACGGAETQGGSELPEPAQVQAGAGGQPPRVTLTPQAVTRVGVATAPVAVSGPAGARSVPFSALLYDEQGRTWVYANTGPRTYLREPVVVARIDNDTVVLRTGPPAGTPVVTVAAAELLGAELGVGGE